MGRRSYDMSARAEAVRRTRESILDAAERSFEGRWYDEVTLADVAKAAGVSQQTVVNHFGSKLQLYVTGVAERVAPRIEAVRSRAVVGDVSSVVSVVVADYEERGDGTLRMQALALRHEELAELVSGGRAAHREWVTSVLAPQLARRRGVRRERLATLLTTALEVTTWGSLRHGQGLGREHVEEHLRALVSALVEAG